MTLSRLADPRRLDVAGFAAAHAEIDGAWPMSSLPRLAAADVGFDAPADVRWQARGERAVLQGAGACPVLALAARTALSVTCQRCLQALQVPLAIERRFFFVEGEDAAAALDLEGDADVLALQPALDLLPLVEDELLLALPLVPRHEVCPQPLPRPFHDEDDVAEPESPFAALAALKRGGGTA